MIVVAGEALVDLVPADTPAPDAPSGDGQPTPLMPRRGGGPYNTAIALGRLGSPTAFCSRVSTDAFGASLIDGLRAANVDTSLVQRGTEPTTLAVANISPDGSAGYSFYAEGTADRLFTLPAALPEGTRALSLGTCSLVLEPGATAYEALLRREAERGVFTALDPNIRAGLIPDADAYRARFRSWLPHLNLLKLSEEDALWLAGWDAEAIEAYEANEADASGDATAAMTTSLATSLKEWLAAGPTAVVLTRGGDGLTVVTADTEVTVAGERVEVADTIGAGDTVNAALLHRVDEHGALTPAALATLDTTAWRDILTFAARAAAITCSRAGAEPPFAAELP